ncbi:phage tail protein I [Paenibacillus harenae]|uniref:Phage tail P2-like protein n=1 Tax=Paenibacillus harenae TaxID=306543 RepID=A0ABT9U460_PAEHA|nr:phage tail protein I [Paenibacillus harenae]MDQ0114348.1 phage tail P2-like protein [Paenibacillus harenae]
MIDIRNFSLLDVLPPSIRNDPTISAAAGALNAELASLNQQITKLTYFNRFESLTSEEADELARQFKIDFYDYSLPIEQRRQLVKNSYAWHKRKGTPSAVEELIATIFGLGEVQEWFQYGGNPGYFKVVTSDPDASSSKAQEFIAAINSVKNVRSWLEAVEITTGDEMQLYIGAVVHRGKFTTVKQVT